VKIEVHEALNGGLGLSAEKIVAWKAATLLATANSSDNKAIDQESAKQLITGLKNKSKNQGGSLRWHSSIQKRNQKDP